MIRFIISLTAVDSRKPRASGDDPGGALTITASLA